jgi:hypothetical protein
MVRNKMEQREYIILCLEDSNDWSNATTRRLVMQVQLQHPLSRTLVCGLPLGWKISSAAVKLQCSTCRGHSMLACAQPDCYALPY